MLPFVCLSTLLASAPAPAAPREDVVFVGFSGNEELAAWEVGRRVEREDGTVDTYKLLRLSATEDGAVVATFRLSNVRRIDRHGRPTRASARVLAGDNPDWAGALPRSEWQAVRRRTRFSKHHLKWTDSSLRLSLDDDVDVTVDESEAKHVVLQGATGSPIGFRPVARLYDGRQIPLGRFRAESDPRASAAATVVAYHSKTGMHVAVTSRFSDGGGRGRDTSLGGVFRLPGSPLATVEIGVFRQVAIHERQATTIYEEIHPESFKYYQRYVQ